MNGGHRHVSYGNAVVARAERAHDDLRHVDRLVFARPTVDNRPPKCLNSALPVRPPPAARARQEMALQAAAADIKMIGNIAREMTRAPSLSVLERKGPTTLNGNKRRKELRRIDYENEKLLKRLESVRPTYKVCAQQQSYLESRKHAAIASVHAQYDKLPPALQRRSTQASHNAPRSQSTPVLQRDAEDLFFNDDDFDPAELSGRGVRAGNPTRLPPRGAPSNLPAIASRGSSPVARPSKRQPPVSSRCSSTPGSGRVRPPIGARGSAALPPMPNGSTPVDALEQVGYHRATPPLLGATAEMLSSAVNAVNTPYDEEVLVCEEVAQRTPHSAAPSLTNARRERPAELTFGIASPAQEMDAQHEEDRRRYEEMLLEREATEQQVLVDTQAESPEAEADRECTAEEALEVDGTVRPMNGDTPAEDTEADEPGALAESAVPSNIQGPPAALDPASPTSASEFEKDEEQHDIAQAEAKAEADEESDFEAEDAENHEGDDGKQPRKDMSSPANKTCRSSPSNRDEYDDEEYEDEFDDDADGDEDDEDDDEEASDSDGDEEASAGEGCDTEASAGHAQQEHAGLHVAQANAEQDDDAGGETGSEADDDSADAQSSCDSLFSQRHGASGGGPGDAADPRSAARSGASSMRQSPLNALVARAVESDGESDAGSVDVPCDYAEQSVQSVHDSDEE